MNRKYGKLRTSAIDPEDFDIIHSEGYSECLRDMISNIQTVLKAAEADDLDVADAMLGLIEAAEEQLREKSQDTH